jgi:hypothetical protein
MFLTKLELSDKFSGNQDRLNIGYLLLIMLAVAINGCSKSTTDEAALIDRSFLTGEPCEAPCWYGLEIDKSSKEDVIAKLDQLPFIDHSTYHEAGTVWMKDEGAREIQFKCIASKTICGGALTSDDVLKQMWFHVGFDLSFKAVADKIGSPDFLDYGPFNLEGGCRIILWWEQEGIAVDSVDEASDEKCRSIANGNKVTPSLKVRLLIYFAEGGFGLPGDCCPRISWPGFAES